MSLCPPTPARSSRSTAQVNTQAALPPASSARRGSTTASPRLARATARSHARPGGSARWRACSLGLSQHPTLPHVRHIRRCTDESPSLRHSSQPSALGVTCRSCSTWSQASPRRSTRAVAAGQPLSACSCACSHRDGGPCVPQRSVVGRKRHPASQGEQGRAGRRPGCSTCGVSKRHGNHG